MKINVKLFGTLRNRFPSNASENGIEVEIPDGAKTQDLLAHLGISESQRGVVIVEGRILRADEMLEDESVVRVFQAVHGG